MKILALDTATEACSAALLIDGRLIAREMELERGHAENILPMIDAVLAEGGVSLAAVDAVAFGRGPGGFTGVRLAASVTQGLAFAADKPVVPVSDLAAVAQRALDIEPGTHRVVVCNDARMHEVYWACFERDDQGLARLVGAEHVGPPEGVELESAWLESAGPSGPASPGAVLPSPPPTNAVSPSPASPSPGSPNPASPSGASQDSAPGASSAPGSAAVDSSIGAVGRGFRAYPQLRAKLLSSPSGAAPVHLISDDLLPRAQEVARLALREIEAGRLVRPEDAIPVYLRDDVARPKSPAI
ncbi:MAG TPA: tRNA (adenosine(37)-N6)-threonylcarbamoyltransferase complex dimerization subunit type 1 TsaB [Steroidobacteraceae bacterium]|nr:tRNA (adenosine(37)-N6)-threonylcarbamoyltransferase complex dimerization subunit type 1 TsaB [Steroidobacteraceae bacterium]